MKFFNAIILLSLLALPITQVYGTVSASDENKYTTGTINAQTLMEEDYNTTSNNDSIKITNLTDGLIAYYPFNGNANDESGNGNHGVEIWGGVTFVEGKFDQAAKFGGFKNPGHIKVSNSASLQLANEASFVVWLRLDKAEGMDGYGRFSNNGVHSIITKDHDRNSCFYSLVHLTAENIFISGAATGGVGWTDGPYSGYSIGEWIQLVFVFDSLKSQKFINGKLHNIDNKILNFDAANTHDLYFGKFRDTWFPLNGAIDEVRIYNRALTTNEVETLYDKEQNTAKNYLTLQQDTIYLGKQEGSFEKIDLSSNVPWAASSSSDWLSVSPLSGEGDKTITLTATDNPLFEKRSTTVTFLGEGVEPQKLTIIQVAYDNTLTVSDKSIWLDYGEGNNETVKVFTTKRWTAYTNADWLSISSENFIGNALINLNAEPNPTMQERFASIEVKADNSFPQYITVTQAAGRFNLLVSTNNLQFTSRYAGSEKVTITSNTAWNATSNQPWLSIDKSTGSGNDQLNILVTDNMTGDDRTGTVTIFAANGVKQPIIVVQNGNKLSVKESKIKHLDIYPNPFTNGFQVKGLNGQATIKITDINGQLLLSKRISSNEYIATDNLQKGIYLVSVITNESIFQKKLIKK